MPKDADRKDHVELLRRFANTLDVDDGTDALETTEGLTGWLTDNGLLESGATATRADLQLARSMRNGLRVALMDHGGDHPTDPSSISLDPDLPTNGHTGTASDAPTAPSRGRVELDDAAHRLPLRLDFTAEPPRLVPSQTGVRGGLAAVLSAVTQAIADGSWSRLKICRADDCQWAFFDLSKNRSRTWCAMGVCGNRNKTRAYRARRRAAAPAAAASTGSGASRP